MIIRISGHARPRSAVQGHYGVASSLFLRLLPLLLVVIVARGRAAVSGSSSDGGGGIGSSSRERCEEITIPMCRGIGYNFTSMPNQFHHDTQEEAGLEVHQFWPLVEIQCSDDLRFFLCSMYAPICMEDYQERLPACRSVCERARAGCAPIMLQYGFAWPERMSCEELPEFGDQERLCMDAKNGAEPENPDPGIPGSTTGTGSGQRPRIKDPKRPSFRGRPFRGRERQDRLVPSNNPNMGLAPAGIPGIPGIMDECSCECRLPNVLITDHTDHRYYNKVETGSIMNCAVPCRGKFFNKEEQNFATFWIGLWAVLCCISTSMTVLTFLIDMQRFRYPERPIIFLSGCYLMISIGYIVRLFMGHEAVACDGPVISYHVTGRQDSCTVVFLLIYFFGMASSLWWVILTLTWLLAAGLKWGNEAIAGYSQYFHLAAWLVPTVKSIVILAIGAVDGDPIAGVCSVGNQDLGHLRGFVLAPLCVYLLLGTSFLLAGFVALFRIRNVIRQQARAKADKLEKLMIRIGVFSVLYTLPATIVIGCYVYEQHFRHLWERKINCPCTTLDVKPDYSVFMLKYFMCLVVGITSGFWIWSGKTLDSWKRFRNRFFCNRGIDEDHRHHHHAVMGGVGLPGSGLIPVGGVLGCTPSAVMMTDPQSGSQIRAFKPMSPVSHVGQVPSSHGKHMPLSHV